MVKDIEQNLGSSARAGKRVVVLVDVTFCKGPNKKFRDRGCRPGVRRGGGTQGHGTQAKVAYNTCWKSGSHDHLRRDCPRVPREGHLVVANASACWGCGFAGRERQDCPLLAGGAQIRAPMGAPQRGRG
ncbi:hypothetical protein V6N13_125024 [Hibiscus sabdariffa]